MNASITGLLARTQRTRKAALVSFAIASGTLLAAAVWFSHARRELAEAYAGIDERQQALATANAALREAELRVRLADTARDVVAQAHALGYEESAWGERLINVAQAPLTRQEVNDLLASIARDQDRLFGAEAFELSVTRPEEGLFHPPTPRTPPLSLTLRGTLLFRTRAAPPSRVEDRP